MRTHTLRNVNKHGCHSKVNVKKGERKKKTQPGRFPCANSWQDDFSSPLCSVRASTVSCCCVQAGKMFICPVSQNAANLGRNLAQLFFLSLVFFNGFPNSLIMLDCALQFESQKIGIARIFSLSICPLCLPVGLARFSPPSITHLNYPRVYIVPQSITEQPPFSTGVYICTETSENIQARRRRTLRWCSET